MACMSGNDEFTFGDSSQLTNWILDYGATCHMTPEVSEFITGSLEDMVKYIEVRHSETKRSSTNKNVQR